MLARWTRRATEVRDVNPWWRYKRDTVTLPSGEAGEYFYVETPGAVMVVPVRDDGRLVLVEQYRYLNDRTSPEFPGGGVQPGASAIEAARTELAEEAGLAAALEPAGWFNPYNGVTNEVCTVFLARDLRPDAATPDRTEEFLVRSVTPEELEARIADGTIWDGMTLAAWTLTRSRLGH